MCASFVRTSPRHASSSGGRDQFPGGSVRSFCSPARPITTIGVPSRRIDPIRYVTRDGDSSRKYVTASVSSGHQIGSKIGPPKPSARAGAAPQSFESSSTAETLIESGSPVVRGAFELLMPSSLGGLPSGRRFAPQGSFRNAGPGQQPDCECACLPFPPSALRRKSST